MNKGERFIAIFFALIVLSAGFSLASFTPKSNDIETQYSAGGTIKGTISISLSSEPTSSLFRGKLGSTYFNESITLIDLIRANQLIENVNYTCSNLGCASVYDESEKVYDGDLGTSSSIELTTNEPLKIVGFKILSEGIISIDSLVLQANSTAGVSCSRQLLADILDKNESFIQNNKNSGNLCADSISYECFNYNAEITPARITTFPYCEKINLSAAPAYRIGARVTNGTTLDTLTMRLQTFGGVELGTCNLPKQNYTTQEIGCDVSYSTEGGEYLVCIYSASGSSGYTINSEDANPKCGTANEAAPYNIDFEIFAQPFKFAAPGIININETTFSAQNSGLGKGLVDYADEYLEDRYQRNCSKGCFIPFKFTGIPQSLTFTSAELGYRTNNVFPAAKKLYRLNTIESKITTPTNKPLSLKLDYAGFKIPINSIANKLSLYLGDKAIFTNLPIIITKSFAFDVYPKNISFGALTTFQVSTSANISSAIWNFGDGTNGTSFGKTISHRYTKYNAQGYSVEVVLTAKDGTTAANSFVVSIGNLRESANNLLSEYDSRIKNLSKEINSFSPFISDNLKKMINLTSKQISLNATKKMLGNATDLAVINSALALDIPASLETSEQGRSIPLEFGFANMNVEYIGLISDSSTSSEETLKRAISTWFDKNYNADIDYTIVSRTDDNDEKTPILTDFKVSITKKPGADESANEAYLIIDYPKAGLVFNGNYSEKTAGGSDTYIPITGSTNIEFLVNKELSISEIGMYISPKIDKLSSYGAVEIVTKEGFNWGKFILWMTILLVVALAIYAVLQQWYKKKYESYLFKNPSDLYNIINFIHNSRKAGMEDGQTGEKLRKAKWKNEQIAYAFRKLDGKRTGMPALPFFRFFERKKITEEIEKRKQPALEQPVQSKQNIY